MICKIDIQCKINKCKNKGLKSRLNTEFSLKQKRVIDPKLEYGAHCACEVYLYYDNDKEIEKFITGILKEIHNIHIKKNNQGRKYGKISNYAS